MGQVAIYCRVSTDDQSCKRQERDLRAFAKRARHKIVAVLKETASGADNARPNATYRRLCPPSHQPRLAAPQPPTNRMNKRTTMTPIRMLLASV